MSFIVAVTVPFPLMVPPLSTATLFPYTTLFRSRQGSHQPQLGDDAPGQEARDRRRCRVRARRRSLASDRKSTRLNSSHLGSSYAVFCLKNKDTEICLNRSPPAA